MIAIVDVDYREPGAVAACVLADDWTSQQPALEIVEAICHVEEYVPGEFYRRELPCLLAVLRKVPVPFEVVVVDGYVWLGAERPGLGAHLFEVLEQKIKVIGVAKSAFKSAAGVAVPVKRGASDNPLWVTTAGIEPEVARQSVQQMDGDFRIPTLIRRADQLCRKK